MNILWLGGMSSATTTHLASPLQRFGKCLSHKLNAEKTNTRLESCWLLLGLRQKPTAYFTSTIPGEQWADEWRGYVTRSFLDGQALPLLRQCVVVVPSSHLDHVYIVASSHMSRMRASFRVKRLTKITTMWWRQPNSYWLAHAWRSVEVSSSWEPRARTMIFTVAATRTTLSSETCDNSKLYLRQMPAQNDHFETIIKLWSRSPFPASFLGLVAPS